MFGLSLVVGLLLLLPPASLSSSCVNNQDCPGVSPCCSGWGWCVGQGSGGSLSRPPGFCRVDKIARSSSHIELLRVILYLWVTFSLFLFLGKTLFRLGLFRPGERSRRLLQCRPGLSSAWDRGLWGQSQLVRVLGRTRRVQQKPRLHEVQLSQGLSGVRQNSGSGQVLFSLGLVYRPVWRQTRSDFVERDFLFTSQA